MKYPEEGILFGEAEHLPGLEAVEGLNFEAQLFDDTREVAVLPDHPDCVVRLAATRFPESQSPADNYLALVQRGISHFRRLEQHGLTIPAQRFVIGPSIKAEEDAAFGVQTRLYAFTERLKGRLLTTEPYDSELNQPVIQSLAEYLASILRTDGTIKPYLWNLYYARQFTVTDEAPTVMHDTGLEFNKLHDQPSKLDRPFCGNVKLLERWSNDVQITYPEPLQQLVEQVKTHDSDLYNRV